MLRSLWHRLCPPPPPLEEIEISPRTEYLSKEGQQAVLRLFHQRHVVGAMDLLVHTAADDDQVAWFMKDLEEAGAVKRRRLGEVSRFVPRQKLPRTIFGFRQYMYSRGPNWHKVVKVIRGVTRYEVREGVCSLG